MAGYQLVKVGGLQSIAVSSYNTVNYACDNFSEVLLDISKTDTNASEFDELFVTINAGNKQVANRIPIVHLAEINQFQAGTGVVDTFDSTNTGEAFISIDTGCWYMPDKGSELSVSITNEASGGTYDIQVYAKVNDLASPSPLKYSYNTDTSFMIPTCETLYLCGTALTTNTGTVTLQYGSETVNVPIDGGCVLANAHSVGDDEISTISLVHDGTLARDMQVNITPKTGTTVTSIGVCKEVADAPTVAKARRFMPMKFKGLTQKERLVMAQGN